MAQSFESEYGRLVKPGAYPSVKVQATVAGLASTGIVAIIGEAEAGMPGSADDITENYFGPDPLAVAAVQNKYVSGPLVDAFRAVIAAANDPGIVGSVSRVYMYKTNASVQASGLITNQGAGTFGTLKDLNYGQKGNLIYWQSSVAQAEAQPTTGAFTFIPSWTDMSVALRVNGGASQTHALTALATTPAVLSAALDAKTDVLCQGGVDRDVLNGLAGAAAIQLTAAGNVITVALTGVLVFPTVPVAGDTLIIAKTGEFGMGIAPSSLLKGAGNENFGQYRVTSATTSTVVATKIRNNVTGALVPPATVAPVAIAAATKEIMVFSPITISDASGTDRSVLNGLTGINGTATASGAGSIITFLLAAGSVFATTPQVGDLVKIPTGSAYAGGGSANVGKYEVTAVSNTVTLAHIVMSRLSNGASITVGATPIVATTDVQVLNPIKQGVAKCLEIFDNGGTDNLNLGWFQFNTSTAVAWLSTSGTPVLLASASEYINQMNVNRQFDNVQGVFTAGGDIMMKVGYLGTTATMTIGALTITTTVTGGVGGNLSVTKADYPSLADLVAFLNVQPGYAAVIGSSRMGNRALADLDLGTYGIGSSVAALSLPGRIKRDLADFEFQVSASSLVSFTATATAGLPDATSAFAYLASGAKGATSPANVLAACTALEGVDCNFVVPAFARDANPNDILDGITDSGSTYTIASVHAAVKSHVLAMSQVKRRKNRQAFLGFRGTFAEAKDAANNMASSRVSLCFQDIKNGASDGSIQQFQPWAAAANAAGMQAAGFYKSICKKFMNVSGVLQAAADYADNSDSQVEDALLNGLLPAERVTTGGYRWVSDQTTYGLDSNFVYNSIQAIYAADIVALSLAQRMENAFVGQTLGDVSAAIAMGFIQAVMSEFLRLKLIAPSDDAASGYKNVIVKIQGGVMLVSMEIKLATAIYFIPISFTVSQVTQTATA